MSKLNWKLAAALLVAFVAAVAARSQDGDSKASSSSDAAKSQASDVPAKVTSTDPTLSADEAKVIAALQTKVDVDFHEATLTEVAEWATKISGVDVQLDRHAITDSSIDPGGKIISMRLRGVSLRAALSHILGPVSVSWLPKDGGLVLTSLEKACLVPHPRVYPVADLVTFKRADGRVFVDYEPLIETLTAIIEPQSWDGSGGPANVHEFDGTLVVNQSFFAHRKVSEFLRQVREARNQQKAGNYSPVSPSRNEIETAVIAALEKRAALELSKSSLADFVQRIAKAYNVNVLIDSQGLADATIDPSSLEISGKSKDASLRVALDRVLGQFAMQCIVRDEVLWVTTSERANSTLTTRVYSIADLLEGAVNGIDDEEEPAEQLEELITSVVSPQTWDGVGGIGTVKGVKSWKVLVVSQTESIQCEIAELLVKLRAIKTAQGKVEPEPLTPPGEDRVELKVYALPASANAELAKAAAATVEKVIREAIAPESWADPAAYVKALPDRIVVRAKRSIHAQVKELLDKLEEARTPTMQSPPSGSGLSGPGPFGGSAS